MLIARVNFRLHWKITLLDQKIQLKTRLFGMVAKMEKNLFKEKKTKKKTQVGVLQRPSSCPRV
jgi:hypothetical protein